jgi:hypothetical protein
MTALRGVRVPQFNVTKPTKQNATLNFSLSFSLTVICAVTIPISSLRSNTVRRLLCGNKYPRRRTAHQRQIN